MTFNYSITGKRYLALNGLETKAAPATFQSVNVFKNEALPELFEIAALEQVEHAFKKASHAFDALFDLAPEARAKFLEAVAENLSDPIFSTTVIERANLESGLSIETRLKPELLMRTVNQLRSFAGLIRLQGGFETAVVPASGAIPDLRRTAMPLGVVVVISPINFPFGFGPAGGDFASAIAAGCPVVAKGDPNRAGSDELCAHAILDAAKRTGMPDGIFSLLQGDVSVGKLMVDNPVAAAIAFTGSYKGGVEIYRRAANRSVPIPVYGELGSLNPIILSEKTMIKGGETLAKELTLNGVLLDGGQYCTKAGAFILIGKHSSDFIDRMAAVIRDAEPVTMLSTKTRESYEERSSNFAEDENGRIVTTSLKMGSADKTQGSPRLLVVNLKRFIADEQTREEIFGPSTLVVTVDSTEEAEQALSKLQGQLTVSLFAEEEEQSDFQKLVRLAMQRTGRVIWRARPTGLPVTVATVHGGVFPAVTPGNWSSVGIGKHTVGRFLRPICFQGFGPGNELLPAEIRNAS